MNTNALFKSLLLGLIVVLFFGCEPKKNGSDDDIGIVPQNPAPLPLIDSDEQNQLSELIDKRYENYKNLEEKIKVSDYENEIIINFELLERIVRQIRRSQSYFDHMQKNAGDSLYVVLRKGINLEDEAQVVDLVEYFHYFAMGDKIKFNEDPNDYKFTAVKNALGQVYLFNELLRCPPMCPTGGIFSDYDLQRSTRRIRD